MGDSLKKVQAGQPIQIPADAYNAFIDTTIAFRRQQHAVKAKPPVASSTTTICFVQNGSGANLDQFAVLGVDDVVISPADNPASFASQIALAGVEPTTDHVGGRFVILLEPIADGALGKACVAGATICKINVSDDGHGFADVEAGTTDALISTGNGPLQVLWKESGTGDGKWAVVRFGGAGLPAGVKYQALQIVDDAGTKAFDFIRFG